MCPPGQVIELTEDISEAGSSNEGQDFGEILSPTNQDDDDSDYLWEFILGILKALPNKDYYI